MPRLTSLSGAQVAVLFDDPLGIVEFDEVADGVPQLRDVAVDATMDDLFLQRAIEPLGDAVGLGLGDEGVGRLDAPELDLVGEVVRQILGAVIHPQGQPPSRAGRGRAIQPGKPHGDRLQGGEAVAALADMPADTLGVPMLDGGEDPAPAVVHREHPNAIGAPHEVRGMSDDLTVMGIAATAAAAMGREQIVLAHQAEHPLAGNPDVATDPKPSPDLAVALALPGRCLQVGFDRHQQRLVRDRGLRSPTLCRRLLGVLAGGHGVERGAGHAPGGADPPQAVGQTRAGRGGGTHRRDLRRPKGPKVSVLASSSSTCMVNSPIRFMALSSSACTGSPLRCLSEASIPPIAFSRHCSSRKISTPNWRDRSCTGSSRKSRRTTSRLRATVHRWPSPSGPAGKAWPGENVDEPSSPAFTTGPSTATFFSKLSVMFRSSLDTSIKPILCPRKSGPTQGRQIELTLSDKINDPSNGVINILEPMGEALLGAEEGEEIEVLVGSYVRRAVIEKLEKAEALVPKTPQFSSDVEISEKQPRPTENETGLFERDASKPAPQSAPQQFDKKLLPDRFYDTDYQFVIRDLSFEIIDNLGPITFRHLCEKIARFHGFQRTGSQIRKTVWAAIHKDRKPEKGPKGENIFWPKDKQPANLIPFRGMKVSGEERSWKQVPYPEKLGLAHLVVTNKGRQNPVEAMAQKIGLR